MATALPMDIQNFHFGLNPWALSQKKFSSVDREVRKVPTDPQQDFFLNPRVCSCASLYRGHRIRFHKVDFHKKFFNSKKDKALILLSRN